VQKKEARVTAASTHALDEPLLLLIVIVVLHGTCIAATLWLGVGEASALMLQGSKGTEHSPSWRPPVLLLPKLCL